MPGEVFPFGFVLSAAMDEPLDCLDFELSKKREGAQKMTEILQRIFFTFSLYRDNVLSYR